MTNYEEFDKFSRKSHHNKMSNRTRSILTVIVSVVIATIIIGLLFSILMNQLINTSHREINGPGKLRSSIHHWIKNATDWINKAANNVTSVEIVHSNTTASSGNKSTNKSTVIPIFGNNGNFFGKFFNAVGKAFEHAIGNVTTTVAPKIDPEGANVYKLNVQKNE